MITQIMNKPDDLLGKESLKNEFTNMKLSFEETFFVDSKTGCRNLVTFLTPAQEAYYKMCEIGGRPYPSDVVRMEAILNEMSAREYILANLIMKGGTRNEDV